jgi:hypothetical protein
MISIEKSLNYFLLFVTCCFTIGLINCSNDLSDHERIAIQKRCDTATTFNDLILMATNEKK